MKKIDEIIKKIEEAYVSNKSSLEDIENYIEENGTTDDGIIDASICFEQGFNNALEFVLKLLKSYKEE